MIKDIILDFDGTIADSGKIVLPIYNLLAAKHGFRRITEDEISFLKLLTIKERCKELNIPLYKLLQMGYDAKKAYKGYIDCLQPVEGMIEVIYKLKEEGYGLSIISSNAASNIKGFLAKNKIDIFHSMSSSAHIFGKHYTISTFLKKHNMNKESVLYIGDEYRDVVSCKMVPIEIIAVSWGYDSPDLLLKGNPDHMAHNPSDILNYIHHIRNKG